MSALRAVWRRAVPPAWRRWARRCVYGVVYRGDFATWADAVRASRGYDDPAIHARVVAAARAVRDGHAAWDRDTVLFASPAANVPLLAALQSAAAAENGRLDVVDFGGALGSTWWQHRPWLQQLPLVRWQVIEQAALVEVGRREFTAESLGFCASLDEACADGKPSVMLLSSVLPYLEDPRALLRQIGGHGFRHIIIDRTGFVGRGRDRLTVQRVPPSIYDASYPCWFFDRDSLLAELGKGWRVKREWATDDVVDIDAEMRGLELERIDA